MSVNPDSIPRYEQPTWDELREPEPTAYECWCECTHQDACRRVYEMFRMAVEGREKLADMAEWLECNECEEFE